MKLLTSEILEILEDGKLQRLTYAGLLAFHQGDAVWGASVGYRAMQAAGWALSHEQLWDRKGLFVVSAHPGPGVRDAIEFVTRCVSRKRFQLLDPHQPAVCNQPMQFRWWVTHHDRTVDVELKKGFVPAQFFELLERVGSDRETPSDSLNLEKLKADLTERLWDEPFTAPFDLTASGKSTVLDRFACTN
ncbi:hypothetical protein [Candidatus Nitrospira allomarina]|uniref:Uncharacterized protein n=1 Tax=Candidatus Nitrospira allomarina TaxID=3020900 RepID=A0AA96G984_9BACT|nr:hypothetical protein [Candidatus Nitrospira allomarina]WNM57231.1 hypothetical protein PP769_14780 [Candidatus Nitrospira allomarina]